MPRWFGQLGIAGGIAILLLGVCEAAADWTFVGSTFWASSLGFMIWVLVAATYLVEGAPLSTHAHFRPPPARNEPVGDYAPGSPERAALELRLAQMAGERIEIPLVIGGEDVTTGDTRTAVMPHDKEHVLADVHQAAPSTCSRRSTSPRPRGRTGRAGRGRSAPPSSSAPPSCSPARGATR